MNDLGAVEAILLKGAEKARAEAAPLLERARIAAGIRPLTYVAPKSVKSSEKKKELSAEELARIEEGRRRAILRPVQHLIDAVTAADDPSVAASELLQQKEADLLGLKKKAKQKAENELEALRIELAPFL